MSAEQLTGWTALIGAVTAIVWPLLAVAALIVFRKPAGEALRRVGSEGGTIEVFGVKLNIGKATEEQQRLIEDLQKQVGALRDRIGAAPAGPDPAFPDPFDAPPPAALAPERAGSPLEPSREVPTASSPPQSTGGSPHGRTLWRSLANPLPTAPESPRLLWVDDHPENNAVLIASLERRGIKVTQVLDTDAALSHHAPGRYAAVISDMGRGEPDAGVMLAMHLRQRDPEVPILIFCSPAAKAAFGRAAMQAGATLVTDSATLLLEKLEAVGVGVWLEEP